MQKVLPLVILLLAACNVQPAAPIAVYGDSVAWGYGDLPGGWVRRVEEKTGIPISNLGIPGERADGGAGRIDHALRAMPGARVVLLMHGGNDWVKAFRSSWCNRICDPDEVENKYVAIRKYLREMRMAIDAAGKKIVFITYWPNSNDACTRYTPEVFAVYQQHRGRLNEEIVAVAEEFGDHVIRTDDMTNMGVKSDFFDCLHPSKQGYEKIAERILQDFNAWDPGEATADDIFKVRL